MRIVLDTNVVVAAGFSAHSASAAIVDALRDGRLELVWNERTRAETRTIVQKIPPLDWAAFCALYERTAPFEGDTHPEDFALVPDAPDRAFAALAAAARAVLVSNDRDFLDVRDELDVTVMTPSELARHHLPEAVP